MKKILKKSAAALAALTLTAALAGCGSSASSAAASTDAASTTDTAASTAETSGENELDKIKAAGKLVIGVEGTYPPFTYHDDNGELTGLDVELGKALAEKLGVEVEFQEAAWDSLLIGIDTGRFDTVINSVSITDERAEKYDFSDPYYYEARRVVVRADDDSINGPEDLNGKKIATNTTNAFIPWYEENGAEVVSIDTSAEAIDLVLSGRADFLGTSVPVLNAYLDEHPDAADKLKVAFVIPNSEDVIAIPVSKGEPEFLDAINAALAELREEGTLKEISEKYLGGDYTNSAYSN
ncbi:transporter substrate-binding domain-containing protein [uncultured Gemmiger sp.]|uniref:transporter substrate-binding domain-containing protein n=1 Tax=uncultured Gemmiger sp. TaxID=1623490 RepID=UPI00260084DA|nr:transporter substrate-binding domain-containing protein [uncultured Gemmiger sp.]